MTQKSLMNCYVTLGTEKENETFFYKSIHILCDG